MKEIPSITTFLEKHKDVLIRNNVSYLINEEFAKEIQALIPLDDVIYKELHDYCHIYCVDYFIIVFKCCTINRISN